MSVKGIETTPTRPEKTNRTTSRGETHGCTPPERGVKLPDGQKDPPVECLLGSFSMEDETLWEEVE